jgi:KaiC/GvpD/RAD55 family RecA-like ATPase
MAKKMQKAKSNKAKKSKKNASQKKDLSPSDILRSATDERVKALRSLRNAVRRSSKKGKYNLPKPSKEKRQKPAKKILKKQRKKSKPVYKPALTAKKSSGKPVKKVKTEEKVPEKITENATPKVTTYKKPPKKSAAKKPHAARSKKIQKKRNFIKTGISGFDGLFEKGIPEGSSLLIAGGAGSGKTLMSLQILNHAASQGKKCLYMSFEESEERLMEHMKNFGWDKPRKGKLMIKRFSIFDVSKALDALMAQEQGELMIDVKPIILPKNFKPDYIVVDSLTAIASAFAGKDSYRSYIEHLFRYFENLNVTSFLITETEQVPKIYSPTGVEEFLADGVIVLYNVRKGDIRENAIEILKMRGAKHLKKIVAMRMGDNGVEVYPEQEVFTQII